MKKVGAKFIKKNKSEVAEKFIEFSDIAERGIGMKVKCWHSSYDR